MFSAIRKGLLSGDKFAKSEHSCSRPRLTAIVLTFNEEQHLSRCLSCIKDIADEIVVVDCHSTDKTIDIASSFGATVLQHRWVNHAIQFNWALKNLCKDTQWVLRIDADEYLTPQLIAEISQHLPVIGDDINGIYCGRSMTFQGKQIRFGGVFPVRVLRLFRYGHGQCENRWMDEHIKVEGKTYDFDGQIIDDNLHSLTWWTDKHNRYACREAVDMLNLEYRFMEFESISKIFGGNESTVKRWLKEGIYSRLPLGLRSFAYFIYRYVLRFGFLDGHAGTAFHFLQGFWYRYLVDAKIAEVKRYMKNSNIDVVEAIDRVLGIRVCEGRSDRQRPI